MALRSIPRESCVTSGRVSARRRQTSRGAASSGEPYEQRIQELVDSARVVLFMKATSKRSPNSLASEAHGEPKETLKPWCVCMGSAGQRAVPSVRFLKHSCSGAEPPRRSLQSCECARRCPTEGVAQNVQPMAYDPSTLPQRFVILSTKSSSLLC